MSFSTENHDRVKPALPLAPMVDIMFLLLVFFLTVSVFREKEMQIDVSLPQTQTAQLAKSPTQIVITLTKDEGLYIGDRKYEFKALAETLKKLAVEFPDESVVIRGDKSSPFGLAVRVMDMAYASGLRNVYVATSKSQDEL